VKYPLRRALLACALSLIAVTGTAVVATRPASAAACWQTSCIGMDPAATGCDRDAYQRDGFVYTRGSSGPLAVRLFISPRCWAAWTKTEVYVGSVWGAVTMKAYTHPDDSTPRTTFYVYPEHAKYVSDGIAYSWTAMSSNTHYNQACYPSANYCTGRW
jgi:hypothetical protein